MCGIFGMVRSAQDPDPARASRVFVALGHLAQQRGRDAAGFALVSRAHLPSARPAVPAEAIGHRDVQVGHCRVVKGTRRWARLWRSSYLHELDGATVALGHTRHASQGTPGTLVNAAPMVVGDGLVGTHNGDINADDLRCLLPLAVHGSQGETDSEVLLLALDRVRTDPPAVCEVLSTVQGLAALAWVDRHAPDLVHLARAALCPLAVARDASGNLYWASSPSWFRRLDERAGGRLGFEVELVGQGTLLTVAAGATPQVVARRSFEPVSRPGDDLRYPTIWDGLDPADVAAFRAEASHRTAQKVMPSPYGRQRPRRTVASLATAAASSVTRRDLPTPTGPSTVTSSSYSHPT